MCVLRVECVVRYAEAVEVSARDNFEKVSAVVGTNAEGAQCIETINALETVQQKLLVQ